jgi:hypothetical protein
MIVDNDLAELVLKTAARVLMVSLCATCQPAAPGPAAPVAQVPPAPAASATPQSSPEPQALPRGLPASRTGLREWTPDDGMVRSVRWVIAGIYELATDRFHELSPRLSSPEAALHVPVASALVDPSSRTVVVVTGVGNNADIPSVTELQVMVFRAGVARPSARGPLLSDQSPMFVELMPAANRARFRGFGCLEGCDFGPWYELSADGQRRSANQHDDGGPRLMVTQGGVVLIAGMPAGFALRGRRLDTPHGPVELGPDPEDPRSPDWPPLVFVRVSPLGNSAAVVSLGGDRTASGMSDEPDTHVVDRVDLTSLSSKVVAHGQGLASVAFDDTGDLYIEVAGRVRHVRGGADPVLLPSGLHL